MLESILMGAAVSGGGSDASGSELDPQGNAAALGPHSWRRVAGQQCANSRQSPREVRLT